MSAAASTQLSGSGWKKKKILFCGTCNRCANIITAHLSKVTLMMHDRIDQQFINNDSRNAFGNDSSILAVIRCTLTRSVIRRTLQIAAES